MLLTAKCPLMHPDREPALDEEAGHLLLQDLEEDVAAATDPVALGAQEGLRGPWPESVQVSVTRSWRSRRRRTRNRPPPPPLPRQTLRCLYVI